MNAVVLELDGQMLLAAFRRGISRVEASVDYLNKINVYPVPDGDTGTNLVHTLLGVAEALAALETAHAGEVLTTIADAALDSARGNSGAIMAEFFQGLAEAGGHCERLSAKELSHALATGNRYARGALDAPMEGTILTAISAFTEAINRSGRGNPECIADMLSSAVEAARQAVESTRTGLAAMRQAGVEDAGARGFLLLVEGFTESALAAGSSASPGLALPQSADLPRVTQASEEDLAYRYCVECVIAGPGIDRRRLREDLCQIGNSVVVAGGREKVKLHVHVNDPSDAFRRAARYGKLTSQKADDMQRQHGELTGHAANGLSRVAVVTDSAADLPSEVAEALDIHIVPLRIHFANRTFLDKIGMSPSQFLEELAGTADLPQTSQPAPGDLRRAYDFLSSHAEHVVAISVAGRISGTLQASRAAARRSRAPDRVTVIDSQNASLGQGLIAQHAAECARHGMAPARVLKEVERAIGETRSFGFVPDLSHALRGGRLPKAIAWIMNTIGSNPILELRGGSIFLRGFVRRGRNPVAPMARNILRRLDVGRRYRFGVAHAGCEALANELHRILAASIPGGDGFVTELGPALSVHGGPGTLIVSVQPQLV
jgi:DegV family protein with EDD domain